VKVKNKEILTNPSADIKEWIALPTTINAQEITQWIQSIIISLQELLTKIIMPLLS